MVEPVQDMDTDGIELEMGCIEALYREHVLDGRVRFVSLPGRKCSPRIMDTFLGFEIRAGSRKVVCPDITSARYLVIFTELGLDRVCIPYDPTRTARILPDLEHSFRRVKELLSGNSGAESSQRRTGRTFAKLRDRLRKAERSVAEIDSC